VQLGVVDEDLLAAADALEKAAQSEKVPTFSEFIRNASPEEKEAVYSEVMKAATNRQAAVAAPDDKLEPFTEERVMKLLDYLSKGVPVWPVEAGRLAEWALIGLRSAQSATVRTFDGDEPAMLVAASWVKRMGPPSDYACVECVPTSGALVDGFRCNYHRACAILGAIDSRRTS